jgi:hypothetical protein
LFYFSPNAVYFIINFLCLNNKFFKGSQDQTKRAIVLQEEEEEEVFINYALKF